MVVSCEPRCGLKNQTVGGGPRRDLVLYMAALSSGSGGGTTRSAEVDVQAGFLNPRDSLTRLNKEACAAPAGGLAANVAGSARHLHGALLIAAVKERDERRDAARSSGTDHGRAPPPQPLKRLHAARGSRRLTAGRPWWSHGVTPRRKSTSVCHSLNGQVKGQRSPQKHGDHDLKAAAAAAAAAHRPSPGGRLLFDLIT